MSQLPTCYTGYADSMYIMPHIQPPLPTLTEIIDKALYISSQSTTYADYYARIAENALQTHAINNAVNIAHKASRRAYIHTMIVDSLVMELELSQPLDIYSDSESDE